MKTEQAEQSGAPTMFPYTIITIGKDGKLKNYFDIPFLSDDAAIEFAQRNRPTGETIEVYRRDDLTPKTHEKQRRIL